MCFYNKKFWKTSKTKNKKKTNYYYVYTMNKRDQNQILLLFHVQRKINPLFGGCMM